MGGYTFETLRTAGGTSARAENFADTVILHLPKKSVVQFVGVSHQEGCRLLIIADFGTPPPLPPNSQGPLPSPGLWPFNTGSQIG